MAGSLSASRHAAKRSVRDHGCHKSAGAGGAACRPAGHAEFEGDVDDVAETGTGVSSLEVADRMLKKFKQATLRSLKTAGVATLVHNSRWRRERLLILAY